MNDIFPYVNKLPIFLYLFLFNAICQRCIAQTQHPNVTIIKNDISMKEIIDEIARQAHYNMSPDEETYNLDQTFDLNFSNVPVQEILNWLKTYQGIISRINNNYINLSIDHSRPYTNPGYTGHYRNGVICIRPVDIIQVAYDSIPRKFNLGDITEIKTNHLQPPSGTDFITSIEGKVPGVFIKPSGGNFGVGTDVLIGGKNSINNSTRPLYVIDGIPFYDFIEQGLGSNLLGPAASSRSYIDNLTIESIVFLKDAEATSIYGSRAANGAILITTRKARKGPPTVNLQTSFGQSKVRRFADYLSPTQYFAMREEAARNDNSPTIGDDMGDWRNNKSIDWQKELIGKSATSFNTHMNISGGTSQMQFLLSGTRRHNTTVYPGDFSNTMNGLHINSNFMSKDKHLLVSFSGSYSYTYLSLPGQDLINSVNQAPNTPPIYTTTGQINYKWPNPITAILGPLFNGDVTNMFGSILLEYKIFRSLSLKANIGSYMLSGDASITTPLTIFAPEVRKFRTGSLQQYHYKTATLISEPQLLFKHAWPKWKVDGLVGTTVLKTTQERSNESGTGFTNDALLNNITNATNIQYDEYHSLYKYGAYWGRAGIVFKDKLIFHGNIRKDGSSRFGPDQRFAWFHSFGVGWIFSQDSSFQKQFPWINFGKLKITYGTTGNDQIGDYQFMQRYYKMPFTYQGAIAYSPGNLPNNHYSWETTAKFEAGIELGLWENRLTVILNHYRSRSSNQLVASLLPESAGAASILANIPAAIRNVNWELTLQTEKLSLGNIFWSGQFNITIPSNTLISYPGKDESLLKLRDLSSTSLYVFQLTGVNDKGEFQFADEHGNNITYDNNHAIPRTKRIDLSPRSFGGFLNTFTYKRFTLDCHFSYAFQLGIRDQLDPYKMPGKANYNQTTFVLNRWQQPGDKAQMQRFTQTTQLKDSYAKAMWSTLIYTDASYLSFKEITLSYKNFIKPIKANVIYYIQGFNMLSFTPYPGMDPQVQSATVLPLLAEYRAGINVQFQKL